MCPARRLGGELSDLVGALRIERAGGQHEVAENAVATTSPGPAKLSPLAMSPAPPRADALLRISLTYLSA